MIPSLFTALVTLLLAAQGTEDTPAVLQVGHVVELRGALDDQGRFVADKAELQKPSSDDVLIGDVAASESDPESFALLGQIVVTDADTKWAGLERGSPGGKRLKVEGSWKGPRRFIAKNVIARGAGRDRIAGRIDELKQVEGGWEARLMIFTVLLKDDTPVEHALPVAEYGLAKEHKVAVSREDSTRFRGEDDEFGKGLRLTDQISLTGQLEAKRTTEDGFDLDESSNRNRTDELLTVRTRVSWDSGGSLSGMVELRFNQLFREQQNFGFESDQNGVMGETFLKWRTLAGTFDITLGRQDFDDEREWIYDQNLDGLRLSWEQPTWHLDLGVATTLTDGSERDNHADNWSLYLDNNNRKKHLAAWVFYRDIGSYRLNSNLTATEKNLHLGVRAIGDFLPQNESWADFSVLSGSRDSTDSGVPSSSDILGWAYDAGTTWSPPFADPLYFTLGYALGTGDDGNGGDDGTFRQTGLQDNTGKFGGVTSFQYYGELIDPELSNLGIFTLGVGAVLTKKTSLDLVYHTYTQDVIQNQLSFSPVESNLRRATLNGTDADIGAEFDVIFGYRRFASWDMELVGAWFQAGDAWTVGDDAFMAKVQLRYRF
ncbi:MAG: hypothetical protein EXS08_04340 [Planctomycetes bacterium]|nr:hypothetical protein [Planctomycetota bacterium]